jgi:hypothetical protein
LPQLSLSHFSSRISSRGSVRSGSRGVLRKKSRTKDGSYASTTKMDHSRAESGAASLSRPKTSRSVKFFNKTGSSGDHEPGGSLKLSNVKSALKWHPRRPDLIETTSFARAHEDWVIESDRGATSPIPVGYQPTLPAPSVLSPQRSPSNHSFSTFHRWEGETNTTRQSTPSPDSSPSDHTGTTPSGSTPSGMETIYIGRAV